MSRKLFSHSLLRRIFDESREIQVLTSPHAPSPDSLALEILTPPPLHLPDVRVPTQYLTDMGLRPALAKRISRVYMAFVARYRQIFESYFRRVIQGGCHHPEYYRDIFVVQFRGTIQAWGSQIMSTAWIWQCRAEVGPVPICSEHINVRVDAAMKAQILSRLGLTATSFIKNKNQRVNLHGILEEESKIERDSYTRMLPASPPHTLRSTIPPTRDPFSQAMSSTCFPASYPPPPCESTSSHRKTLVTRFLPTTSANDEKQYANCNVDVSSLIACFSRVCVTASAQEDRKCVWAPRSKKSEPLAPFLSPVVAGVSDSHQKVQSLITETTLPTPTKSIAAPRKRRIAALPTRHTKATTVPILDPSSPSAATSSILTTTSKNATLHTPILPVTSVLIIEGTPADCVTSSPATGQYGPPTQTQYTTGTSDNLGSGSVLSRRRKTRPLPRRVTSQSQAPPSQTRPSTPLSPLGQKICSSNVSRTPSLVSDTSSCADPLSSSDEFDTPPSTPPSYPHGLAACNALAANVNSKPNPTGPFGLPILVNAGYAVPRTEKGIRIDFTNGDAVVERQLCFTFRT